MQAAFRLFLHTVFLEEAAGRRLLLHNFSVTLRKLAVRNFLLEGVLLHKLFLEEAAGRKLLLHNFLFKGNLRYITFS